MINASTINLLLKSVLFAFTVAFFSTAIGVIAGFSIYKFKTRFRNFLKIVLLIPLFIPPYVFAVAWKDFLFYFAGNSNLLASFWGAAFVLVTVYSPLSILIIGTALSNINSAYEESALLITGLRGVILKIVLPLIKPALLTSFVLVFIFALSEFSVPVYFGVKVFTTEIFTQFSAFYNYSLAISQSILLALICVVLLFTERKYIADAPFFSVESKGQNRRFYNSQKLKFYGGIFLTALFLIFVIAPFVILIIQSFANGTAKFTQALNLLLPTFWNSVSLAFFGALLITAIGAWLAYYSWKRKESLISKYAELFFLLTFALPSIVTGIILIKIFNRPSLNFIYSSSAIILLGYVLRFSFVAIKLSENAIKQIPRSLEEVAVIEGISFRSRLRKIIFPLLLPSLFAAFTIGFIFSMSELSVTITVFPPGMEVLPVKAFTLMANSSQALASSMNLIVFILTLIIISVFYFLAKPVFKKFNFTND